MKSNYKILVILILAAVALGGYFALSPSIQKPETGIPAEEKAGEKAGEKADFTLKSLSGEDVSLSDYRGKVVLINVWATWCAPCVYEIPELVKLRENYKDKGFEILGVVVNSPENQVKNMVKKYGMAYPILWGTESALAKLGHISAIPRTFIVNTRGQVVEDITGRHTYADFENLLKKHLPAES